MRLKRHIRSVSLLSYLFLVISRRDAGISDAVHLGLFGNDVIHQAIPKPN